MRKNLTQKVKNVKKFMEKEFNFNAIGALPLSKLKYAFHTYRNHTNR